MIILEMLDQMASDTGSANRVYFEDRFVEKMVEVQLDAKVSEIDEEGITFQQRGWTRGSWG